jgi:hypothetical protein
MPKRDKLDMGARQPIPRRYCQAPDFPDSCEMCFTGFTATHYIEDTQMLIKPHRTGRCEKHINELDVKPLPK